jgi:hypothetical protein
MARPAEIIEACRDMRAVEANANDCHKFAAAVAATFGVTLVGTADQIMAQIQGPGWTQHLTDGAAAAAAAAAGELVIAGMTSQALDDAHGHVVVVVEGELNRGKYPVAYWGSLNERIRPNGGLGKTINFSFSTLDRDNVIYASCPV